MIPDNLFSKHLNVKVEVYPTLFPPDFQNAKRLRQCAFCGRKLYEMRFKPLLYCKSKLHKRFVLKIV